MTLKHTATHRIALQQTAIQCTTPAVVSEDVNEGRIAALCAQFARANCRTAGVKSNLVDLISCKGMAFVVAPVLQWPLVWI